jgi:glycosyltransferase involved in cell wall biosynthesis
MTDAIKPPRYVIVTPVRDEEAYLRFTVESVIRQTIRPVEYVIVNDGSKDSTGKIIDDYARQYPWIRPVHRKDRGFRKVGGGIIEAFYDGYNVLSCHDWGFLAKLDGDLSFEPDYFEKCFEQFQQNPRLGIGGGTLYHMVNGKKQLEPNPAFHVRGGAKIFRRACWEAIGGLWVGPGTDTLDEVKANMLGWTTMSFPDLHLIHHRFTGSAYGLWGGMVKNGIGSYVAGYHPLYMLAKCVVCLFSKPPIIGSLGMLYGFAKCYVKRTPQVNDPELIRYLRRQQLRRLMGRETIWR